MLDIIEMHNIIYYDIILQYFIILYCLYYNIILYYILVFHYIKKKIIIYKIHYFIINFAFNDKLALFRILSDIAIGSHLASDHSLLSIVINASRRVEIFKKEK